MAVKLPSLEEFRVELKDNKLVHLVFDMPGRTMNVFSNKAILELGIFSDWLKAADVKGVVIRSGKSSAFCAGADLSELGVAYDMIVAARSEDQFDIAFNHFFPLSHAIRKLERAGKPVAIAVAGLALGGGCELALGGHYRVATTDSMSAFGLPESMVGLFPGAGGTQRMPRIVGLELGLDILLNGTRLSGEKAVEAGLVNKLVEPGKEIAACENWLLSDQAHCEQIWDREQESGFTIAELLEKTHKVRGQILSETLGHYPAPLAILNCVEQACHQPMDIAIRSEMSIFSNLIKRQEPRNMIRTLFHGKSAYNRAVKNNSLPSEVTSGIETLKPIVLEVQKRSHQLAYAGFKKTDKVVSDPVQNNLGKHYWISNRTNITAVECRREIAPVLRAAKLLSENLSENHSRMIDYFMVSECGFPAYLGGPLNASSLPSLRAE